MLAAAPVQGPFSRPPSMAPLAIPSKSPRPIAPALHQPPHPTPVPAPATSASPAVAAAPSLSASSSSSGGGGARPQPPSTLCAHLAPLLATLADETSNLSAAVRWSLKLAAKKKTLQRCSSCQSPLSRSFLCLTCCSLFCAPPLLSFASSSIAKSCTGSHAHHLYLDLTSQAIFCGKEGCGDYVYHPEIERCLAMERIRFDEANVVGKIKGGEKKRRSAYQLWKPTSATKASSLIAPPRGMRNLGQTCYMSVVLQSFLHNPILRGYWLADRHNRFDCPISGANGSSRSAEADGEKPGPCMSCEMDRLFSEAYAPKEGASLTPFGPTHFLYAMWLKATELSGYAQQDSHEFLISLLNLLHTSSPGSTSLPSCPCIVHKAFSGTMRSKITCEKCGNESTSEDPFLDLSLEIKPRGGVVAAGPGRLEECLTRFTNPEHLSASEYSCSRCGDAQAAASKRLSLHRLPPVLNLQLKVDRFEHTASSHKIDTVVNFPLKLDMRPYTSAPTTDRAGSDDAYIYDLSSAVCHEGQLNNGHFTAICRNTEDAEFYSFDDANVRRATLQEALGCKAYLLTYVKRTVAFA
ncbi:hypothetical protein MNV49_006556 [Pseudohyphozyma bogoriensis]|nr:hypothetical protein MNV49_006556 [Pseudohyphozyma bogoriensis]